MVDFLKRLFEKPDAAADSPADRDHALRLATAALFFEVVRADGEVGDEERRTMVAAIRSAFDIGPDEIDALVKAAEERSRSAVSLYELTHLVDRSLGAEEKKRIVELLWLLAFADTRKHPLEEHLVRTVAGLLHVSHPDFIDAKIRARRSLE
jgi:uncharacterized tellurite resistance protein B-like protein